jgi:hypothetical protein
VFAPGSGFELPVFLQPYIVQLERWHILAGHGTLDRGFARGDRIVESDDLRMAAGHDVVNDFDLARTDRLDARLGCARATSGS